MSIVFGAAGSIEPNQALGLGDSAFAILACAIFLVWGLCYGYVNFAHFRERRKNSTVFHALAEGVFASSVWIILTSVVLVFVDQDAATICMRFGLTALSLMGFVHFVWTLIWLVFSSKTVRGQPRNN